MKLDPSLLSAMKARSALDADKRYRAELHRLLIDVAICAYTQR